MEFIPIFLAFLVVSILLIRTKLGLKLFLTAVLFCPYLIVGQYRIRIELIVTPLIIFILFAKNRRFSFTLKNKAFNFLLLLLIWEIFVTIINLIWGGDYNNLQLISLYSSVRLLFLTFIFGNANFNKKELFEYIVLFGLSAIPIALFTIGQFIGNDMITEITLNYFVSPSRAKPSISLLESYGRLLRAMGVFETPVYAASYFLLVIASNFYIISINAQELRSNIRIALFLSTFLSFVGGLLTLSTTFLAGLIVFFVLFFMNSKIKMKLFSLILFILFLIFVFSIQNISLQLKTPFLGVLSYQIGRITNFSLFKTRYSIESGILNSTIKTIAERPITGWGFVLKKGVFIGDSLYVGLLYNGGIIALMLLLFFVISVIKVYQKEKCIGRLVLLWTLMLMATGIGSPSLFIPRLQDWYWAIVALSFSLIERSKMSYEIQTTPDNT